MSIPTAIISVHAAFMSNLNPSSGGVIRRMRFKLTTGSDDITFFVIINILIQVSGSKTTHRCTWTPVARQLSTR
jgi:hypothetical protein